MSENNTACCSGARLIGQQLCSVAITIDYISLGFVKYPLTSGGQFLDRASIDIEEGYEVASKDGIVIIRKGSDLKSFQKGAACFLELIGDVVASVEDSASGELQLRFESDITVRLLTNQQGFDSFNLSFPNGPAAVTRVKS